MTRDEIIAKIKAQDFPLGSYVVFGSGPLAVASIRPTDDIDLVVTPSLYMSLQQRGWRFKADPDGNPMLYQGDFEVSKTWCTGPYRASFDDLYAKAELIDGIPFVNLHEVANWKKLFARPKDLQDLMLIEDHLTNITA
jgi:hypothetical protein